MSVFCIFLLQQGLDQMPRWYLSCFQTLMWSSWYYYLLCLSDKSALRTHLQIVELETIHLGSSRSNLDLS